MAKRVTTIDDIDGTEPAETFSFAVEGQSYTVDLGQKNRAKIKAALQPFIDAGTRVGYVSMSPKKSKNKPAAESQHLNAIRDWANKNGFTVSYRGKVPQHVVDAFDAAHDAESVVAGKAPAFSAATS